MSLVLDTPIDYLNRRPGDLALLLFLDLGLFGDDVGQPVPELIYVGRLPLQPCIRLCKFWPPSF